MSRISRTSKLPQNVFSKRSMSACSTQLNYASAPQYLLYHIETLFQYLQNLQQQKTTLLFILLLGDIFLRKLFRKFQGLLRTFLEESLQKIPQKFTYFLETFLKDCFRHSSREILPEIYQRIRLEYPWIASEIPPHFFTCISPKYLYKFFWSFLSKFLEGFLKKIFRNSFMDSFRKSHREFFENFYTKTFRKF